VDTSNYTNVWCGIELEWIERGYPSAPSGSNATGAPCGFPGENRGGGWVFDEGGYPLGLTLAGVGGLVEGTWTSDDLFFR